MSQHSCSVNKLLLTLIYVSLIDPVVAIVPHNRAPIMSLACVSLR